MVSQIFKKKIPRQILYDLLDVISLKKEKYYILNNVSLKKAQYNDLLAPFIDKLKFYYHDSKQFYATRDLTYNRFITIIRHICKANGIPYTSDILYDKSSYDIHYYIYY
jgi:hypothetical protein